MTAEEKLHLAELAAMPDESIDTSDIPELTEEQWQQGRERARQSLRSTSGLRWL